MNPSALRIIDANCNRAAEGLRVAEDYTRFVLNDGALTTALKQLRHGLTTAVQPLQPLLASCRDADGDVGAVQSTATEYEREDVADVAAASLSRAQQALRCIEEFTKTVDPAISRQVEPLRYRLYTVQRSILTVAASLRSFDGVHLQVLLDGRQNEAEFASLAQQLIEAGAGVIQLRDKHLDDRTLLQRARRLRELTRDTGTRFIMNDRPDLARLSSADGVHVGQEELTPADARVILGAGRHIGVSTHNMQQVEQSLQDGATYIGCGPVFPSTTKQFSEFAGLEFLQNINNHTSLPAFAIGGITLENLSQVLATGFRRVAVSGALLNAADPAQVVREFNERLMG